MKNVIAYLGKSSLALLILSTSCYASDEFNRCEAQDQITQCIMHCRDSDKDPQYAFNMCGRWKYQPYCGVPPPGAVKRLEYVISNEEKKKIINMVYFGKFRNLNASQWRQLVNCKSILVKEREQERQRIRSTWKPIQ